MHKVRLFLNTIDTVNERVGNIFSFLAPAIVVCILYGVVARSLFRAPTVWAHELSTLLFGGLCIMGGGYALRHKAFVNVDIVYCRLPTRLRGIFDLLTSALFFLFCFVLIWHGWQIAWKSLLLLETTETVWDVPIYPLKLALPVGAFLVLLQGLAKFVRDLTIAIKGRELL